jgi:hypothetical protein
VLLHLARLSPDGERILYPRPLNPPRGEELLGGHPEGPAELVMLDLGSGKESVLEIGTVDWEHLILLPDLILFDPSGRMLALPDYHEEPPQFLGDYERPVLLYEVATGRTRPTPIRTDLRYARIDSTGRVLVGHGSLVHPLAGGRARRLKVEAQRGSVSSVSPVAPLAVYYIVEAERDTITETKVLLWDFNRDALVASLPVELNWSLDDAIPQWTSNGQYVYYPGADRYRGGAGGAGVLCRVWDGRQKRVVANVRDCWAVGPGPTPDSMILREGGLDVARRLLLHHPKTDTLRPIALEDPERFVHAWRDKVLFTRDVDKVPHVFVADLAVPKGNDQPSSRPAAAATRP